MGFIDAALNRTRTFGLLLFLIIISGIYSYLNIPKEDSPDVPLPIIYVSMNHDGISPEDAVKMLVKPMEKELKSIDGVDDIESSAYEGGANVTLTFIAGVDNDIALDDVRNKVDIAKAELPDETDEPTVTELNIATFPIITVVLNGAVPEREMKRIAENLEDEIGGIGGVLKVEVNGLREEQLLIEVDKALLESYNISPSVIYDVIQNSNLLIAAGSMELDSGKYAIKVPSLFKTADDVLNLPIITDGDKIVKIKDIGEVKLTFKDASNIARVNGSKAVTLAISKRIGENIIEVVDEVRTVVEKDSKNWPDGVNFSYVGDLSKDIRIMLYDLQNSIIFSIILVMIVILSALGVRSSALVATAIPGSFLMALLALYAFGFTMNVVVLFALILSVGMLVDGAIVVTELADRKMHEGEEVHHAFAGAAKYMAWPIIASTATTLAVFFPLLFWPGIMGEFMKFMPLTLIFTLTASLLMALIFLPIIGASFGQPKEEESVDIFAPLTERYNKILVWCIERPGKVLLTSVITFFVVMFMYGSFGKGMEFFPNIEPERANVLVHSRGDYSLAEKDVVLKEMAKRLVGIGDIETLNITTHGVSGQGQNNATDIIGTIFIQLEEWHARENSADNIFNEVVSKVDDISGVWLELQKERGGPQQGKPIKVAVRASNEAYLAPTVAIIKKKLIDFEGTIDVTDTLPEPGIEWQLKVNREETSRSGTSLAEVGTLLRLVTTGAEVGKYRPETSNDEIDVIARLNKEGRSFDTMDNINIATSNGHVPISNFVEREAKPKVTTISRLDQKYVVYVEADVAEGYLSGEIVKALREESAEIELPKGISIEFKGDDEDQQESQQFLMKAFIVAIFAMAIILVTQFNNFYQVFIILSAVILSIMGVLMGHLLMGKPFGVVMSGLGVIALAGIVVNNNIVLIDTYNKMHNTLGWKEALVETGKRRLRPVLLTAITTVIGLLPMGLKLNFDLIAREVSYNTPSSQWWDQLANSIIFGLAFATVLTLIITPCMIALGARKA